MSLIRTIVSWSLAVLFAVVGMAPPASAAVYQPYLNVQSYGAVTGDTGDQKATILAAATALNAIGGGDLSFPAGTYRINTNLTIPATVRLVFTNGAILHITSGHTITINGQTNAGPNQKVFSVDDVGTQPVAFSAQPHVKDIYPQWFGAVGDNSATDTTPVQAAITSANGAKLYMPVGTYKCAALTPGTVMFDGPGIIQVAGVTTYYGGGYAAAIPSTGTWRVGDVVTGTVPAVGSAPQWVCTVAGTPGTWVTRTTDAVHLAGNETVAGVKTFSSAPLFLGYSTVFAAPTTGNASINLPHGTAPSSPVNGDLWTTTAGMYAQINGAPFGPFSSSAGSVASFNTRTGAVTLSGADVTGVNGVLSTANTVWTQAVSTSGSPTFQTWTCAAHTTLTTGTEATDFNFNGARTVQFATTTPTTQRFTRFQAPTYSCSAVSQTITTAATVDISGAPAAGTNVTITNPYALWVEAGNVLFAGAFALTGIFTPTGGIAAAGGFVVSPRCIHVGGRMAQSFAGADGTTKAVVVTEVYIGEVIVPCNMTITGVVVPVVAQAGNVKVGLCNSSGTYLSVTSASTAVGTAGFQRVPFTGTYAAVGPAIYYVVMIGDNASFQFVSHTVGSFGAAKQTGQVYSTGFTTITPPTTFTTGLAPMASLY